MYEGESVPVAMEEDFPKEPADRQADPTQGVPTDREALHQVLKEWNATVEAEP